MLRTSYLLSLCAALGALGCGQDSPTGPEYGATPVQAHYGGTPRPAGGSCATTISFLPPVSGQPANVAVIRVGLDCTLRHLGLTSGELIQTIVSSTTDFSNTLSATIVYVAANGDELHATFAGSGVLDPSGPSVRFSGTETYTGGTGRFRDAAGSSELVGSADLRASVGEYSTSGTLRY